MSMSRRNRVIAAVCAVTVVAAAAADAAALKPKAGKWKGTTSERNSVTLTVSSNRATITKFTTTLGYDHVCHYGGGAGGFSNYSVVVPKMTIKRGNTFSARVTAKGFFHSATITVSGKFSGAKATGTVIVPTSYCGPPHTTLHDYSETFTARHG